MPSRFERARRLAALCASTLLVLLVAACGDSDETSPTTHSDGQTTTTSPEPVELATGEGTIEASGGDLEPTTIVAPLVPDESSYDPADEGELRFADDAGQGLYITWKAGTEPEVEDAFIRVDLGFEDAERYPDALHTQCTDVRIEVDDDKIEGTASCEDLPNFVNPQGVIERAEITFEAMT
ncbi:MAG: hypothetical protein DYH08_18540 [Actinobacteria bacterium ATB1]|nr:hypothetical protein [Actinobacteria bacterium ATB1]